MKVKVHFKQQPVEFIIKHGVVVALNPDEYVLRHRYLKRRWLRVQPEFRLAGIKVETLEK